MCFHHTVARVNDPDGPVINSSVGIDASVRNEDEARYVDASVGTEVDAPVYVDASVSTAVVLHQINASVNPKTGNSMIKKIIEARDLQFMHINLEDKKILDAFVSQSKIDNRCLTTNTKIAKIRNFSLEFFNKFRSEFAFYTDFHCDFNSNLTIFSL